MVLNLCSILVAKWGKKLFAYLVFSTTHQQIMSTKIYIMHVLFLHIIVAIIIQQDTCSIFYSDSRYDTRQKKSKLLMPEETGIKRKVAFKHETKDLIDWRLFDLMSTNIFQSEKPSNKDSYAIT